MQLKLAMAAYSVMDPSDGKEASTGSSHKFAKGILRKRADESKPREKRSLGGIKWDEPTIAEHDAERGTRMKIDEAPTPYERGTGLGKF